LTWHTRARNTARVSRREVITQPPQNVPRTTVRHRVGFYQTDAMGIMHHANYMHLLENARVRWLEEHHRPYTHYIEAGRHFSVTRVDIRYRRAARFDEELCTTVWVDWVRGASLAMAYVVECGGELVACGHTEHAMVSHAGRPVPIPADARAELAKIAARQNAP
jgi:acyl-CoA thioester hydrolase